MPPEEHPTLIDEMGGASSTPSAPDPVASHMDTPSVTDDKRGDPDLAKNELDAPAKVAEAKATPEQKGEKQGQEPQDSDKEAAKPAPFHEHPDWQRMVKERNTAIEKTTGLEKQIIDLQSKLDHLAAMPRQSMQEQRPGRDYDKELAELHRQLNEGDISQTEHATQMINILRAQNNEQLQAENTRIMEQMQKEARAREIENAFYRENPDFDSMMLSGKIAEVKGTSPMHDDFSAYWAAKYKDMEAQVQEQIDAARKEERAKTIQEIKAGQQAASLDGSTVTRPKPATESKDDISKVDVKKVGGVNKFLADRLEAARAKRYGG